MLIDISTLLSLQGVTVSCRSDGRSAENVNSRESLLSSLASAAACVRRAVTDLRELGAVSFLIQGASTLHPETYDVYVKASMENLDCVVTNWAQLGHSGVNFGSGPANFSGHWGKTPAPIVILPDMGEGWVIFIPGVARERAHAVIDSPLSVLVPICSSLTLPLPEE